MDHWPEWGMPVENWRQQGSYVSPIEEALPDPAAGTLVCIPPLNPALLKYIAGCLDQLRNPSTYDGLSDADIALSLQRADTLRGLVGHPVACAAPAMYEVRLNACVLEQSTDGGATWTAVAGWDGLAACLPGLVSTSISVPANPLGVSTSQQACNIAGYVAQQIINGVFNVLQQAISEGRSAIQFVTDLSIAGFVFRTVFPWTTAALLGVDALLSLGASIGASELATIVADVVLWDDITCAIFAAIQPDGHITASNWPTAIADIRAISYSVPGVSGGIADWLQSVDMATVYEWQQLAPLDSVDCSACPASATCVEWKWYSTSAGWTLDYGSYVAGTGFAALNAGTPHGNYLRLHTPTFSPATLTGLDIGVVRSTAWTGGATPFRRVTLLNGGSVVRTVDLPLGAYAGPAKLSFTFAPTVVDDVLVEWLEDFGAVGAEVGYLELHVSGANPFTLPACVD